jgi:O-antigen/teichoic acid export membrane protein
MTTLNALFAKTIQKLGVGKGIAKEGAWSFILRAANTGLGFISTVLLARWLGTEGYGIYAYALAWTSVLAIPAQAGLPHLVVRETALGVANNRPELVKGIWRWAGQMVTVLSLSIAVIFGIIFFLGRAEAGSPQALTMAWALVLLPISVLGDLRGAALRGLKRVLPGQLPEFVIRPGLLIFFVLGAGWLVSDLFSPELVMMLNVGAALAAFAIGAWMLWKNTPESVQQASPVSDGKKWLMSSLMFALMSSSA